MFTRFWSFHELLTFPYSDSQLYRFLIPDFTKKPSVETSFSLQVPFPSLFFDFCPNFPFFQFFFLKFFSLSFFFCHVKIGLCMAKSIWLFICAREADLEGDGNKSVIRFWAKSRFRYVLLLALWCRGGEGWFPVVHYPPGESELVQH